MPPPNNNQAATTDYGQAVAEFGSVYDPQVAAVHAQADQALQAKNTALAQYQQDRTTKLSQLDQAKTNAFTNNALTSNARGIMYSGYTPFTNNAYTVNTYNPNVQATNTDYQRNVAQTNTAYAQNYKSLEDKIAEINQQRANDAYNLVQNTKQAQAQAARSAGGGSGGGSGGSLPQGISYKNGASGQKGFNFNLGGSPVSAARYAQLTGVALPTLLKQMGSEGDVTAAQAYQALQKSKGKWTPAIQSKFSSIFWGV